MKNLMLLVFLLTPVLLTGCPPVSPVVVEGYLEIDGCDQVTLAAEILDPEFPASATFQLRKEVDGVMRPRAQVVYNATEVVKIYEATSMVADSGKELKFHQPVYVMAQGPHWYRVSPHVYLDYPVYLVGGRFHGQVDGREVAEALLFVGILSWLSGVGGLDAPSFAIPSGSDGQVELPAFGIFRITDPSPATYDVAAATPGRATGYTEKFIGVVGNPFGCEPEDPTEEVITVPDVTGLPEDEAHNELEDFGLVVDVNYECHDTVTAGLVTRVVPAVGTEVARGSVVTIFVSTGDCPPETVTVPDVTNLPEDDARDELEDRELVVNVNYECHDTVTAGLVTRVVPAVGTEVARGSLVTIFVSIGACPSETVTVPDVTGLPEEEAVDQLEDLELIPTSSEECSDTMVAGLVIRLSPLPGSEVMAGTIVNLVVSTGSCDVMIPDVTNLPEDDARDELEDRELVVNVNYECHDTVTAGLVTRVVPAVGTEVARGSLVTIFVSIGACPSETVTVPDVTGSLQAVAESTLTNVGLLVGNISEMYHPTIGVGRVINTDPVVGTIVPIGSTVALAVSLGPVTPPEMSVTITSPAAGSVYEVGATVTVKVIATGDPTGGPYRLIVRNAELTTRTVVNASLDFTYSLDFTLNLPGSGAFTAYLEANGGSYVETFVSYSVL